MFGHPPPKPVVITQLSHYRKIRVDPQAAAQAAAVDYWGAVPCGGSVQIQYVTEFTGVLDTGGIPIKSVWAAAPVQTEPVPCTIRVNSKVWTVRLKREDFPDYCALMVHEYGHLFGHPDLGTDSPRSITYPIISGKNRRVRSCVVRYLQV